jgi:hypothetical protein
MENICERRRAGVRPVTLSGVQFPGFCNAATSCGLDIKVPGNRILTDHGCMDKAGRPSGPLEPVRNRSGA